MDGVREEDGLDVVLCCNNTWISCSTDLLKRQCCINIAGKSAEEDMKLLTFLLGKSPYSLIERENLESCHIS